jgi:hypothetical protein
MGADGDGRERLRTRAVPRMQDIALAAGVSASTVSRILNDAPTRVPIAPETRRRVLAEGRKLGYRPNPLARALRGAPTMLLGAVVRDFSDPFFAGAIEALAVEAMARGYNVVLGHATGRLSESIALPEVIETRHTDAVVILGDMQDQPRLLADLRASPVPIVALWHGTSLLEFPTVDVDDRAGVVLVGQRSRRGGGRLGSAPALDWQLSNPIEQNRAESPIRDLVGRHCRVWRARSGPIGRSLMPTPCIDREVGDSAHPYGWRLGAQIGRSCSIRLESWVSAGRARPGC